MSIAGKYYLSVSVIMNMMNKVFFSIGIGILLLTGSSAISAQMPMIDRGDGYAVYPNQKKSTTDKVKEIPTSLFDFFSGLGSSSGTAPTPLPTQGVGVTPGVTPNASTTPVDTTSPIDSILQGSEVTYSEATIASVRNCMANIQAYRIAEQRTGVSWKIIAGIHYMEGNCGSNKSCVSGRQLGVNEPDLYGNCSSGGGEGRPVPVAGGCGFRNLVDSCIYGGNHLKGKIQGRIPRTLQELAYALGRYNGLGNRNCGKTPYAHCPPSFDNDDHIYPMSKFDRKHETMYLVYCADYTTCNPPRIFQRIGALSVARILTNL